VRTRRPAQVQRQCTAKSAPHKNAHRHGLSLSVFADPARHAEIESLAHLIAGEGAIPEILGLARRIAEAQIDLQRVRYARHQLLSNQLDDPYYDSRANVRVKMSLIGKFKFALILSQEVNNYELWTAMNGALYRGASLQFAH
jgi:hypothetical protein